MSFVSGPSIDVTLIWPDYQTEFLGANVLDEKPFIIMPYLQNGNARDFLQAHPNGPRNRIVRIDSVVCNISSPYPRSTIFALVFHTFILSRLSTVTWKLSVTPLWLCYTTWRSLMRIFYSCSSTFWSMMAIEQSSVTLVYLVSKLMPPVEQPKSTALRESWGPGTGWRPNVYLGGLW